MKLFKQIYFIMIYFLFAGTQAYATTYWASTTGNGATCGTTGATDPGSGYTTFAKGVTCLASGDILYLKSGTYTGSVNWTPSSSQSGTFSARTTVAGAPGQLPSDVILQPTSGIIFHLTNNMKFFRFANMRLIVPSGNSGINLRDDQAILPEDIIMEDLECTTSNQPGFCILEGGYRNIIRRSRFYNVGTVDTHHAIYGKITNGLIEQNYFESTAGWGVHVWPSGHGGTIRYNRFRATNGIHLSSTIGGACAIIHDNTFTVGNSVETMGAIRLYGSRTCDQVWNNTMINMAGFGIYNSAGNTGVTIKNNVAYGNSGGQIVDNAPGIKSNNVTSGTASNDFVDSANGNFALKSTATSLINAGTVSPHRSCNGTCDIGAYESVPTTGITAASTDNSIDISFPLNLNVPLLPSSGITGFTLSDSRSVTSAIRLSDSVIRLTYSGTCTGGTFSYSPGNLTDSSIVGNPNLTIVRQPVFAISNYAITNSCGGGGDPPPPGLYIHYKFDEGTGTNVNDETANNLDGTLVNSPSWVTGRTGNAVSFADGVQDNVAVPYGNGVNPSTQSLTIAFDFYPTTSGTDELYFGSSFGSNQRLYIGRRPNNTLAIGIQANSQDDNTEFSVALNTWYRACLVMNSSTDTATLHLNGVAGTSAQSVKTYTSYTLASNFEIGRVAQGTGSLPGVIIDNFKLWTSVESCADDYAAEYPAPPPQTGTFTQASYQFYLLRKDTASNILKLPGTSSAANTQIYVPVGAVVNLDIQTNCDNVANCDPVSQILQYDVNSSGLWTPVSDNCAVKVCFYGTLDTDASIPSGTPSCPLSGALACVDGGTQRTASAIPNIDLGQNNSTVNRYVIQNNGALNDVIRFRLVNQNGEVFGTYSQYPTMTIVGNLSGAY